MSRALRRHDRTGRLARRLHLAVSQLIDLAGQEGGSAEAPTVSRVVAPALIQSEVLQRVVALVSAHWAFLDPLNGPSATGTTRESRAGS